MDNTHHVLFSDERANGRYLVFFDDKPCWLTWGQIEVLVLLILARHDGARRGYLTEASTPGVYAEAISRLRRRIADAVGCAPAKQIIQTGGRREYRFGPCPKGTVKAEPGFYQLLEELFGPTTLDSFRRSVQDG